MSPDDVKALRRELGCTARELAAALSIEPDLVTAWERGELFPTKRHVGELEALRAKGPGAIPKRRRKNAPASPMQALAEADLWRLFRKILAHPELRSRVEALAESYGDPADDAGSGGAS